MVDNKSGIGNYIQDVVHTIRQAIDPAFLTIALEVLEIGDPRPESDSVIRTDYGLSFMNHSLVKKFVLEQYEIDGRIWVLERPIEIQPRAKREFTLIYSYFHANEPNRFQDCRNMTIIDSQGEHWVVFLDSAVKAISSNER